MPQSYMIQFHEPAGPGQIFAPGAFADAEGGQFQLMVDGQVYGTGVMVEAAVIDNGTAVAITIETEYLLPPGELGARQVLR